MDFAPQTFKKGEMVRFFRRPVETLGIVKGQDGGKVEVQWILWWGESGVPQDTAHPVYKLLKVDKAG